MTGRARTRYSRFFCGIGVAAAESAGRTRGRDAFHVVRMSAVQEVRTRCLPSGRFFQPVFSSHSSLLPRSSWLPRSRRVRPPSSPPVLTNDNRRAAGAAAGNTLSLNLRAEEGLWRPEGDAGPALRIEAFGEEGGALQVPAPLIRVREGTTIVATIRNALDRTLTVRGLCARDGQPCAPIDVPAAGTREVRFTLDRAGTYHYWATTTGMPLPFRGASDTQLSGALVVDRRRG